MKRPLRLLPLAALALSAARPASAQSRPRHGALMINEFYRGSSVGAGAWVEVYNPNLFAVDASGAAVLGYGYDSTLPGTYICDTYTFPAGTVFAAGAVQSVPMALCGWGRTVINGGYSGEIAIRDAGGVNGWDFVEFNLGSAPDLPPNLRWTGSITTGTFNRYARRVDDLDSDNSYDFVSFSSGATQGALNPGQMGARNYDELGSESAGARYANTGKGPVIHVAKPFTLREIKVRVNSFSAQTFYLVARQRISTNPDTWSAPIYNVGVNAAGAQDGIVSFTGGGYGLWSPGDYVFQIYGVDYSFYYRPGTGAEQFEYGTVLGDTEELAATPTNGQITMRAPDATNWVWSMYFLTDPAPAITTPSLPAGRVGTPYSQTVAASPAAASWAVASGALPAGLSLNTSSGTISGTPTAQGTASFSLRACDANPTCDTRAFSIAVVPQLLITTSSPIFDAEVGVSYLRGMSATGGVTPYTWSVLSGMPPGLSMSGAGLLSGTPTASGAYSLSVRVTDSQGFTDTKSIGLTVQPPLAVATASLPNATNGVLYNQTLVASGGQCPCNWAIDSGALPGGMSLSLAGVINGTPTALGTSAFTVRVYDNLNGTATRALSITVVPGPLSISTATLPDGIQGVGYPAFQIVTAGGSGGNSFAVTAGALPPGLSLGGGGALSGTPVSTGSFPLTVTVTDAASATASRSYTLVVSPPPALALWNPRGDVAGNLSALRVSPNYPTDGALLATSRSRELFLSQDRGQSWTSVLIAPSLSSTRDWIDTLRLSPIYTQAATANVDAKTLYAASQGLGLLKSTDQGATFTQVQGLPCTGANPCAAGVPYTSAVALSPAYASDHTLWTVGYGSTSQVYRSTDGGASWTASTPPGVGFPLADFLEVSPQFTADHTLFVSFGYLIFRSIDSGANWTQVLNRSGNGGVTAFAISPSFSTDGTILFTDTRQLLFRSTDFGQSFIQLPTAGYSVAAQARSGQPARWLLTTAAGGYGLLYSDDAGATFTPLPSLNLKPKGALALPPPSAGSTDMFVNQVQGIFGSFDAGLSFQRRDGGVHAIRVTALAGAGNVLAATSTGGWLKSVDGGVNWTNFDYPAELATGGGTAVAVSPAYATDRTLFMGGNNFAAPTLMRSTDGGASFVKVASDMTYQQQIALAPNFNPTTGTAFVIARDAGNSQPLWRSVNGGQSFSLVSLPAACRNAAYLYPGVYSVAISPSFAADGAVFVFADAILCRSTDGGTSWAPLPAQPPAGLSFVALAPTFSNLGSGSGPARTIITGDYNFYYRSVDGGATWTQISFTPSAPPAPNGAITFSSSYALDGTVFILGNYTAWHGLWKSVDFGQSFVQASTLSPALDRFLKGLYLPPNYDNRNASSVLVAGSDGAAFWRSANTGASYARMTGNRSLGSQVTGLARGAGGTPGLADPGGGERPATAAGDLLYAATADHGVFVSDDNGFTFAPVASNLPANANAQAIAVPAVSQSTPVTAIRDAGTPANQGLYRYNGASWTKIAAAGAGNYVSFLDDGTNLYAARADGVSLRSGDGGSIWTALQATQTDLVGMDYNNQSTPTFTQPASKVKGPSFTTGNTASLWAVSAAGGPRWSGDSGASWTATPGTNDYALPSGQSWTVVKALGINPVANAREVIAGSSSGLFLSRDGGVTWKSVSGAGSGLETTSKNFTATLSTATAYGTTDILVGATGSTNGGVYLSGDGGQHWTQVNQGFDPNNLSISSLVKTSCSGCPVQYYSGTYGAGVYTRTIGVNPPPQFPSVNYACAGAGCTCGVGPFSGPVSGGTPVKLCGSGFQNGLAVEFDGLAASGCAQSGGTTITCTATPPHAAGYALVRVRNPDTRAGTLPGNYQYTGGTSRASALYVAKSGANGWVSWNCAGCDATNPARLYRAQNAAFSLYLEQYNGGASGTATGGCTAATGTNSCYNQTGTVASAQSYFWSVE